MKNNEERRLIDIASTPSLSRIQRAKRSQPWLDIIWRKVWAISTLRIHTPAGVQRLREALLAENASSPETRERVAAAYLHTSADLVRLGLHTEHPPPRLPFFLDCIDDVLHDSNTVLAKARISDETDSIDSDCKGGLSRYCTLCLAQPGTERARPPGKERVRPPLRQPSRQQWVDQMRHGQREHLRWCTQAWQVKQG